MEGAVNFLVAGLMTLLIGWLFKSWWRHQEEREARGIVPLSQISMNVDAAGRFYSLRDRGRSYVANWKAIVGFLLIAPTLAIIFFG